MANFLCILLLITITIAVLNAYMLRAYKSKCKTSIRESLTVLWSILAITILNVVLNDCLRIYQRCPQRISSCLSTFWMFMLYIFVFINLTYVYYVAFIDMDCLYTFEYIIYYNFAFQFIRYSCIFLFRAICDFTDRIHENRRNVKIQDLMRKSKKSLKAAQDILEQHVDVLDTARLSKDEIKIIRSEFSTRNNVD